MRQSLALIILLAQLFQAVYSPAISNTPQSNELVSGSQAQQAVQVPLRPLVCSLELAKFGKIKRHKGLLKRVERLEKKVFGHTGYIQEKKDFDRRINDLVEKVKPSEKHLEQGFNEYQERLSDENDPNWFLNPPDVEWMNKFGRGIKRTGVAAKEATARTKRFVTSPEFVALVGAAALLVGAFYLAKYAGSSGGGYGANPDHVYVRGHWRGNQWIPAHWRTRANGTTLDNFGTKGNYNPYTGQWGTKTP